MWRSVEMSLVRNVVMYAFGMGRSLNIQSDGLIIVTVLDYEVHSVPGTLSSQAHILFT